MHPRCPRRALDPNLTWREFRRSPQRTLKWIYRRLTARWRGLPAFYIAGPKKTGTTSLFWYLLEHPRVLAPFRKEVKFYTYQAYLSPAWYRANFPWERALAQHNAQTLDATPDYFMHPAFPQRMRAVTPQARVIVLLRDPVRRVLSHYFGNCRNRVEPLPLMEALRQEAARIRDVAQRIATDVCQDPFVYHHFGYLTESRYIEHLERLWRFVPREQVLVLRSEDLFTRPEPTLDRIAAFLGLEPWRPKLKVYNKGRYPDDPQVAEAIPWLRAYFRPYNERLYQALGWEPWEEDAL
ncbi:MAG: sulfotransferase domain-containing protein [Chloroflexi bacterium]|nr:sulfotransferase domain-containing protein [Chloroflexota bacterium]